MNINRSHILLQLLLAVPAYAALSPSDIQSLPRAKIEAQLPQEHPSSYLQYAARLFGEERKDDAVFWFYVGSIRYRFHLAATPNLDPSGDPALFGSLQAVIGQQINEYAGADPTNWIKQVDRALKWDDYTDNGFTSKQKSQTELTTVREGLIKMRAWIDANREEIAAQRKLSAAGSTDEMKAKVEARGRVLDAIYQKRIEEISSRDPVADAQQCWRRGERAFLPSLPKGALYPGLERTEFHLQERESNLASIEQSKLLHYLIRLMDRDPEHAADKNIIYAGAVWNAFLRVSWSYKTNFNLEIYRLRKESEPNKAPEPTPTAVTPRAIERKSK